MKEERIELSQRERRVAFGELVVMDSSEFRWFIPPHIAKPWLQLGFRFGRPYPNCFGLLSRF